MKRKCIQLLAAMALLLLAANAQAVISCNISSPGFTTAYNPAAGSQNITQSYVTVTCSRTSLANDPNTLNYSIRADNGLYNVTGTMNRARRTGPTRNVNYDLYRDSGCSSEWRTASSNRLLVNMTFSGLVPASVTIPYWGCIPAGQTGLPAGIYDDTVTMTLRDAPTGGTTIATNTFGVHIHMSATCNIATPPGTITFNYMSFGPAINPTTTFSANCTSLLPYTMALDATSGTLLGLNYSLALSASSSTGTGSPQLHTITGTMAAGQSGTCAAGTCSASQPHTLTITY